MEQKIVAHLKDGRIHKGVTQDFDPARESFHMLPAEGGGVPLRVRIEEMKALFWVRDYIGNREFVARRRFDQQEPPTRRAVVVFADGEEMWGTLAQSTGDEEAPGFFFTPADKEDNNVRVFIVRSALRELRMMS